MEERIEMLEPALRAAVRALLVLVLTDDIRVYLGNHDQKAFRQAWDALEQALPGILHYYRTMRLELGGYGKLTVGLDGKVWSSDYPSCTCEQVGQFDEGTTELTWLQCRRKGEKRGE